jgi:hypothetical protein
VAEAARRKGLSWSSLRRLLEEQPIPERREPGAHVAVEV